MFYSHQLLARKAPLGQIWMAATMHAKINRRNLDKIDIVKICEEILNPSIPLALRLTGILMGGVVIVYERKVKLLYEDVTRLLVQINEAWRVTTVGDPTLLPKGKSQAKFEAITMKDGDEMEQALHFSNTTFDHWSYYPMRLDRVEEFTTRDDDQLQLHQVDPSHITLQDDIESHQAETNIYDRFERFDIEDGEENNLSFTPQDLFQTVDVPQTPKQTPPPQEPLQSNEIQHEQQQEPHDESTIKPPPQEKVNLEQQRRPNKRRRPRATGFLFDNEHIIIEGNQYQSWLQDTSDIISRTRTKKLSMPLLSTKINKLMDLPTLGLISGMDNDLLELWKKSSMKQRDVDQPGHGSSSHLHENNYPPEHSFEFAAAENFQGDLGAQQHHSPVEKGLPNIDFLGTSDSLKRKLFGMTAGSSGGGQSANSISSSASGPISLELEPKLASGSTSKRRAYSSASHSSGGLDRVDEEIILGENRENFKLPRVSEDGSMGEFELLVETAPTQTPKPIVPPTLDRTTHSILNHLKEHFDMRGAPQTESLNQLAFGMNPSQAAKLFYQTCVLASHDFVTVEQVESYGDISISRGAKM